MKQTENNKMNSQSETIVFDKDPSFVNDSIKAQVVYDILLAMEEEDVNKTELAEKLDLSKQYISKILNESANFTIKTLVNIACSLNKQISIRIYGQDEMVVVKRFHEPFIRNYDMPLPNFDKWTELTNDKNFKIISEHANLMENPDERRIAS